MEVGTQVWLRSSESQWGWVPAMITKKASLEDSSRSSSPVIELTLSNDHRLNNSKPNKNFYPTSHFETKVKVDPEHFKTADHPDIKLRNTRSDYRSAGEDQETGEISSPTNLSLSNVVGLVHDLIGLTHLHEPAILHALRLRYEEDIIYTSTGPILIAVNPFKSMNHLYNDEVMERYRYRGESISSPTANEQSRRKLSPHVYQTADDAYRAMILALDMNMNDPVAINRSKEKITTADQSILVSGESGAGKTVTTKFVLNYFAMLSKRSCEKDDPTYMKDRNIEQQVLQSNPILESFGNARTIRNDNSSRFGKYIDVRFSARGRLSSASIQTYLLEKVRLIQPGQGERNYHIFYQFLDGADSDQRKKLLLDNLTQRDFRLLSETNTFDRRDGVSDKENHKEMMDAMKTIGFDETKTHNLMRIVTAILFAGNMTFSRVDGAHHESCTLDRNNDSLTAASLLGVTFEDLSSSLTSRKISAGLEKVEKLLSLEQATKGLEALMKAIYGATFDLIVKMINNSILEEHFDNNHEENGSLAHSKRFGKGVASIGVLDIFGFESFNKNGFEQICINYTNEALQQQFNKVVFEVEQQEYEREGIVWKFVSFPDNQDVLDLIDLKHTGILAILDEQCIVPQSSDEKFTRYLYTKCGDHKRFIATSSQRVSYLFSINHYAGDVEYSTENWLEKNKDELPAGSDNLIMGSEFLFLTDDLKEFFKFEQRNAVRRQSTLVNKSVGAQFAEQLKSLRSRIDMTVPHYIRCLKPNDDLLPNCFDPKNVVEQLRYGGVLEAVRVSRAGYPTRYSHDAFLSRYGVLMEDDDETNDDVSVISSWTTFGANESNLKNLISKIAFNVWKEEQDLFSKMNKAEEKKGGYIQKSTLKSEILEQKMNTRNKKPAIRTLAVESTTMGPEFRSHTRKSSRNNQLSDRSNKNSDAPESEKDFLSLDFASRCGVAGLQLGKNKVFLRREAFERIEAMRSRKYFGAVCVIQSICRGYVYRKRYVQISRAILLIQSIVRMSLAKRQLNKSLFISKVIQIQSVWRRAVTRHTVWRVYLEIKNAAVTIQRAFRRVSNRMGHAAVVIQKWLRGMIVRITISRTMTSIVKIQAFFRGARTRLKVLDASDEENVQAVLRARLNRVNGKTEALTPRRNAPFKVNPDIAVKKTVLYQLIQDENWASVESTLDQHPKLAEEVEPSSGELPLHILARHNDAWTLLIDMVVVLFPKALVHRDRMGALPIHHASAYNNVAALEIIYSSYKDGLNESDSEGRLPIHVAAEFDAVDAVKYLLAKAPEGAYTAIQSRKAVNGGGLPLHAACRNCASIGVITAFLAENFASAKKTDDNGDLPLHLLLRNGDDVDQVLVKTLLTCFSTAISRTDMNGDLPLTIALKNGCKASVVNTILLQYPSAATISDSDGHTPLFLAFLHGAEDRTVLGLLNHAPELATIRDEKTSLLPIELAAKKDNSAFIIHNLLRRDMPIDLKEKVRAKLLPHRYSWNFLVNDTEDKYHMVVTKLLQQCTQPQVLALAHVEGSDGEIALASATPVCKHELRVMLRLFNTLEVVNPKPAYTNPESDTQIFYAMRYDPPPTQQTNFTVLHEDKEEGYSNHVEDFDDNSMYSSASMSTTLSTLSGRSQLSVSDKLRRIRKEKGKQVIAKLTSRADIVERELKVRKDFHLSRHYVPAIISVHHTVQHAAYSEAMAEPGYCITMEGADTTAENLILDVRKSGMKFPTKALKRIGISLLHMHEHGLVHCDFGTHNIGKFGSRWKLLGVGGSVPIGQRTNPNRGFYHPPESISVETKRSNFGKKSHEAEVIAIAAKPTYDIWSYGVILYETITGIPLGPYACRGKRRMTQHEVSKIGRWDDHYVRKAIKAIELDDEVVIDLLKKLLNGDPKKRFGSMRTVLEHPFFKRESSDRRKKRSTGTSGKDKPPGIPYNNVRLSQNSVPISENKKQPPQSGAVSPPISPPSSPRRSRQSSENESRRHSTSSEPSKNGKKSIGGLRKTFLPRRRSDLK